MPIDRSPLEFKILRNADPEAPEFRSDFAGRNDHAHVGCSNERLPSRFGNSRRTPAEQEEQTKDDVERQNRVRGCHAPQCTLNVVSQTQLFHFRQLVPKADVRDRQQRVAKRQLVRAAGMTVSNRPKSRSSSS
jgi:hypothetical protein